LLNRKSSEVSAVRIPSCGGIVPDSLAFELMFLRRSAKELRRQHTH
jgi:hypothetical protein